MIEQRPALSIDDITRILVINALVRYNLLPIYNGELWNAKKQLYDSIYMHLLPPERYERSKRELLLQLLSDASLKKTPRQKMNLYGAIAQVTGDDWNMLASPVQRSINTLAGLCTYTLATYIQSQEIPRSTLTEINKWREFHNELSENFLWDTPNPNGPWKECVLVVALCQKFFLNVGKPTQHSCLYALAVILQRNEIIERLQELNITPKNLPKNILKHYEQYILDNKIFSFNIDDVELSSEDITDNTTHKKCCALM